MFLRTNEAVRISISVIFLKKKQLYRYDIYSIHGANIFGQFERPTKIAFSFSKGKHREEFSEL